MRKYKLPIRAILFALIIIASGGFALLQFLYLDPAPVLPWGRKTHLSAGPDATKILFIGNSFTYTNDVPSAFCWLLRSYRPQEQFCVESFTMPLLSLEDQLHRGEVEKLFAHRSWDYVILQEQSGAAFSQRSLKTSFEKFAALIKPTGAKTLAVMTWADRGLFANQCIISQLYRRLGRELNIGIVPAGDLFFVVQEQDPAVSLYQTDEHHPDAAGAYLYALAVFAQLFGDQKPPFQVNEQNLAQTGTVDQRHPPVSSAVANQLCRAVSGWAELQKSRPEFRDEAPNRNVDIAYDLSMRLHSPIAVEINRRRLDAIKRLFATTKGSAQEAFSLVRLAQSQLAVNTSSMKAESCANFENAADMYAELEGPKGKNVTAIKDYLRCIQSGTRGKVLLVN